VKEDSGDENTVPFKWHIRNRRRHYKLHGGHVAYTKSTPGGNDLQNEEFIKIIDTNDGNEVKLMGQVIGGGS